MSIFNELCPKLIEIYKSTANNFNVELQGALACLDQFEEEFFNSKGNAKDGAKRNKALMTTLQSINEGDDEATKTPESAKVADKPVESKRRVSKKRSKDEVDGVSSPEQDKRAKRNASVKAQGIISQQVKARQILKDLDDNGVAFVSTTRVNVNLTQKLRREGSIEKKSRRRKDNDKENAIPTVPPIQIKQEKISLVPEPMETDILPPAIEVKREHSKEATVVMPPPVAPPLKSRKAAQKEKQKEKEAEESSEEESGGRRRTTRTRKQDSVAPAPAPASTRSTRASSRASSRNTKQAEPEPEPKPTEPEPKKAEPNTKQVEPAEPDPKPAFEDMPPPPEPRPKRTRAKKKVSTSTSEADKNTTRTDESAPSDNLEKCDRCSRSFQSHKGLKIHISRAHTVLQSPRTPATDSTSHVSLASPAEKPRPKRTRRGKNAEKEADKSESHTQKDQDKTLKDQDKTLKDQDKTEKDQGKTEKDQDKAEKDQGKTEKDQKKTEKDQVKTTKEQTKLEKTSSHESISLKKERISECDSPVLKPKPKKNNKNNNKLDKLKADNARDETSQSSQDSQPQTPPQGHTIIADKTQVNNMNVTVVLDRTMVLPNGVFHHAPHTPKNIQVDKTVVLESHCRETMVLDKGNINDATVVLDKDPRAANITDDNSLLTSDEEVPTTPPKEIQSKQPTSAVKEKVQQFEELAARTTRTKTRAMAKLEDADNHTPPDKMIKPVLSLETLNKMNNMIFNGKPPQVSSTTVSASKPRAVPPKPTLPLSTSKLSALHKYREEKEREDARKKKEALLDAKRELQKKKREEKMANAAAAREAAERERKLAMEAAARERMEKQLHADQGKLERLKEVERKKQELARKAAETEERRKAEEQARQQRLADEQKKAELARKKQLEEAEAMKKEALMAKEIEKRQKEYLEKQKMKLMSEKNYIKTPGTPGYYPQEPVYMADGFQYLNSDEEDDTPVQRPVPAWSTSKARRALLAIQSHIPQQNVMTLFGVRIHSPDLRELFPNIERGRLKRTSSAVWRTPPRLPMPTLHEL